MMVCETFYNKPTTKSQIAIGELIYNPETQTLHKQAVSIDLEPRTVELLELLLTSVGHPLSAELSSRPFGKVSSFQRMS